MTATPTLEQRFVQHLQNSFPFLHAGSRLLLACSGGLDSMVLLHLLVRTGFRPQLAHGNFQLRGSESERDERFVQERAAAYGLTVYIRRFETEKEAAAQKTSIQETARHLRYSWFEALRKQQGLDAILTAHQADDNLETVCMQVFRGTGIRGLHGIPPRQNHIIRPLLFASRAELAAYAQTEGLPWVEDSSNQKEDYTRNFFRRQVLPLVKQAYPAAEQNLLQNIEKWREAEMLYEQAVDLHRRQLCDIRGEECFIPVRKLARRKPLRTILYEIVHPYGFRPAQLPDVLHLLEAESGRYVASPTHRILRHRDWLVIAPLKAHTGVSLLSIEEGQRSVAFDGHTLQLKPVNGEVKIDPSPRFAFVDAREIRYPLILRKWKQGDYFYPLGMRKKKKLSRFLIDLKLSLTEKENLWVLESDRRIVWVVGHRIDDRFKVRPDSLNVLQLELRVH